MVPFLDTVRTQRRPIATLALIGLNVVAYLFLQPTLKDLDLIGDESRGASIESRQALFRYEWSLVPCELTSGDQVVFAVDPDGTVIAVACGTPEVPDAVRIFEPFPGKNVWLGLLTTMFLHGSLLHLAGNVLFLWVFGNNVEDVLGIPRYVALYIVGGLIASAAQVLSDPDSAAAVVGASGAVAAVMGAYLVQFPRAWVWTWIPLLLVVVLPLPAAVVLVLWFLLQFFTPIGSDVAAVAHIAGFVFGVVAMLVLRRGAGGVRRPPRVPERPPPTWRYAGDPAPPIGMPPPWQRRRI